MRPLLELVADQPGKTSLTALLPALAARLCVSEEDQSLRLNSGQTRFINNAAWAKSDMVRAGLATPGKTFTITDAGRAFLQSHTGPISRKLLEALPTHVGQITKLGLAIPAVHQTAISEANPQELIEGEIARVEIGVKAELLSRLQAEKPSFFETFINDLLLAIGYGKGQRERGFVTGRSSDGGIDGIIHEDMLGLDAVYIQAKRYQPGSNVGPGDLRGFVGAMTAENASKGVFVTTSGFTREAKNLCREGDAAYRVDRW